jgi:uncharacterized protein YutE (UPF0331/DUF86 family)
VVDGDVLRLRIEALLEYLVRVDRFKEVERERFVAEPDAHHLAERYLQLAVEAALDIAHHIIAARGYAAPVTYRDAFVILCKQGVLPSSLAMRLQAWAGLRDALVHDYLDLAHGRVWDAIQSDLEDLCAWAATAAGLLAEAAADQRSR